MSKVFIEEETLIGIGNAIREKNGTTDLIATTDMATAISNLATGGGATYPDLWYNSTYGTADTRYFYVQFDVSNASKLILDYELKNSGHSTSYYSKWTLTAGKGYSIKAGSNNTAPSWEFDAVEDNAIQETVFSLSEAGTGSGIEIDVQDFSTISLQIAIGPATSGSTNYYGCLHLFNIQTA